MIYHSTNEDMTDPMALKAKLKADRAVEAAGGTIEVSKSFYHGPARLVLTLPEGVDPNGLVEGVTFAEYVEGANNGTAQ